jgi:hypothetical protein
MNIFSLHILKFAESGQNLKKKIEVELSPKTRKKSKEIPKEYNQDLNKNPKEQPDF